MKKFTFRVDVISDVDVDVEGIRDSLTSTVEGHGEFVATTATGSEELSDQGLKVWAKRVMGVSLVPPKPAKAKPVAAAEAVEA